MCLLSGGLQAFRSRWQSTAPRVLRRASLVHLPVVGLLLYGVLVPHTNQPLTAIGGDSEVGDRANVWSMIGPPAPSPPSPGMTRISTPHSIRSRWAGPPSLSPTGRLPATGRQNISPGNRQPQRRAGCRDCHLQMPPSGSGHDGLGAKLGAVRGGLAWTAVGACGHGLDIYGSGGWGFKSLRVYGPFLLRKKGLEERPSAVLRLCGAATTPREPFIVLSE